MELSNTSEFADEYQDWLAGNLAAPRAAWFDIPVGQLEPHPLLVVSPDTLIIVAIEQMHAHDRGAVLVVHGEQLVGIFTERDVLRRVLMRGLDPRRAPVCEAMTRTPDVLPEWSTLAQALRTMARARYRHLPVVDGRGRPIAIVSMRRIIQYVCETFPKEILNAPPERQSCEFTLEGGG